MLDRTALKCEAKNINAKAQVNVYLFSLVFLLSSLALNALRFFFNSAALTAQLENISASLTRLPAFFERVTAIFASMAASVERYPTPIVTFVLLLVWFLISLFNAGYTFYIMGIRRGEKMGYGTLLDGFSFAGKVILLDLLLSLYIALWSALFIVPGIIAIYRYSFALYNLLENPDRSVLEVISLSRQQTYGHKWELFVLDLSFLGWSLLVLLTAGILTIYVKPFRTQSWICYFERIKAETAPDPSLTDDTSDPTENDDSSRIL